MFPDMQKQWSSSKYEVSIYCLNLFQIFGEDTLRSSLFVTICRRQSILIGWVCLSSKKFKKQNRNSGEQYFNRLLYGESQKKSLSKHKIRIVIF